MTEIEEDIEKAKKKGALPHAHALTQEEARKRPHSAGERMFDRIVYTGIGFGVNELSSLWITVQFKHGKNLLAKAPGFLKTAGSWFSAEGFDTLSQKFADLFKLQAKPNWKGEMVSGKARAGNSLLMATLLIGGTLIVWPMKKLEDNRIYFTTRLNHLADWWRGDKRSREEITIRDAKVAQEIACSPRQSWPTMLLGRATAMLAAWGLGTFIIGPTRNEALQTGSRNLFAGAPGWLNKKLGGSEASKLARFGEKLTASKTFGHYAEILPVETYSCLTSSGTLEAVSKILSKNHSVIHDPELCKNGHAAKEAVPSSYEEKIKTQQEQSPTPQLGA